MNRLDNVITCYSNAGNEEDRTECDKLAIRLAENAEREAVNLYRGIAKKTENDTIEKFMEHVADEEVVHEGEFSELMNEFSDRARKMRSSGVKEAKNR